MNIVKLVNEIRTQIYDIQTTAEGISLIGGNVPSEVDMIDGSEVKREGYIDTKCTIIDILLLQENNLFVSVSSADDTYYKIFDIVNDYLEAIHSFRSIEEAYYMGAFNKATNLSLDRLQYNISDLNTEMLVNRINRKRNAERSDVYLNDVITNSNSIRKITTSDFRSKYWFPENEDNSFKEEDIKTTVQNVAGFIHRGFGDW